MKWLGIMILAVVFAAPSFAQGILTVTTDKEAYEHGEPIEVRVRIDNPTNETFYLYSNSGCQADFHIDVLGPIPRPCTLDQFIRQFNPGSWREWIWEFDPKIYGLPSVEGHVTIIGSFPGRQMTDSLTISAPAYAGGQLNVLVLNHVTESELSPVLDSLNVTILASRERSNGRLETWHIEGTTLDTAIDRYTSDPRFGWVEKWSSHLTWITVHAEQAPEHLETSPSLSVYPNPCRAQCEIDFSGGALNPVGTYRTEVFDMQGRSISTPDDPGSFDATALPTGVYVVRVTTRGASVSKPFVVVR